MTTRTDRLREAIEEYGECVRDDCRIEGIRTCLAALKDGAK